MVNLNGLNMLNSVQAGTQQRSSSPVAKDSTKESFKDVLNKNDKQAKSQDDSKPQARTPVKSEPQAKLQDKTKPQDKTKTQGKAEEKAQTSVAPNAQGTPKKQAQAEPQDKSEPQAASESKIPSLQQNKVGRRLLPESEVPENMELVETTEAGADGIPGAPDPGSGMRATPDFSMSNPAMLAMANPVGAKSKEIAGDSQVDNLTRRAVWSDFLRKMNEEFGVDAEKVLEAFSTLSEKELAAPPEQNVGKLVAALGLNPEQTVLAQKMFTDLIHKTQSKSLGEELANSSSTINLSLMSQRELQRRQLQTTLDKMNSSFFMSQQGKLAANPVKDQNASEVKEESVLAPELGEEFSQASAPVVPSAMSAALGATPGEVAAPVSASSTLVPTSSASKLNKIVDEMEPVSDDEVADYAQAVNNSKAQMLSRSAKAQMAAPVAAASAAAPAATTVTAPAAEGAQMTAKALAQALGLSSAGGSRSKSKDESSGEESGENAVLSQLNPMDRNLQAPKSDAKFQLSPTEPQQGPVPMAVPDLINQARVMVRDGGGEMKVSLTPEGLGEVAMKVSVEKGRVNVEMITESDAAKKLIEKGLVDLKSSLHSNNLSVDSIKVDTASNMGRQLEQQYQDAQRQQAHNFLENFRQNQQGWRNENFASPSAQFSKSQSQASASSSTPYPAPKRSSGARRLDLVA